MKNAEDLREEFADIHPSTMPVYERDLRFVNGSKPTKVKYGSIKYVRWLENKILSMKGCCKLDSNFRLENGVEYLCKCQGCFIIAEYDSELKEFYCVDSDQYVSKNKMKEIYQLPK
jgi:hypothetical protein